MDHAARSDGPDYSWEYKARANKEIRQDRREDCSGQQADQGNPKLYRGVAEDQRNAHRPGFHLYPRLHADGLALRVIAFAHKGRTRNGSRKIRPDCSIGPIVPTNTTWRSGAGTDLECPAARSSGPKPHT